jgi:hypothetical protein
LGQSARKVGSLNGAWPRHVTLVLVRKPASVDAASAALHAEAAYPGWLEQLLTHPVRGFRNWPMLFEALNGKKGVIKAFLEVRPS